MYINTTRRSLPTMSAIQEHNSLVGYKKEISDLVTSIENGAYANCTKITSLLIPNSVIMPKSGTSSDIPLTDARTKIQYFDVVSLHCIKYQEHLHR